MYSTFRITCIEEKFFKGIHGAGLSSTPTQCAVTTECKSINHLLILHSITSLPPVRHCRVTAMTQCMQKTDYCHVSCYISFGCSTKPLKNSEGTWVTDGIINPTSQFSIRNVTHDASRIVTSPQRCSSGSWS